MLNHVLGNICVLGNIHVLGNICVLGNIHVLGNICVLGNIYALRVNLSVALVAMTKNQTVVINGTQYVSILCSIPIKNKLKPSHFISCKN